MATNSYVARIQAQITAKEAALTSANAAYLAALEAGEAHSFMLDTGEGKQAVTHRDPAKLYEMVRLLERDLDRLYRRLNGGGVHTMRMQR